MPKKKIEKTEQAITEQTIVTTDTETALSENEQVAAETLMASEFAETLFADQEQPTATGDSPESATEKSGEASADESGATPTDESDAPPEEQGAALQEDNAGELDKTRDFTLEGDYSGPLDIERRLDEEIAALDAEISANSGAEQYDTQASPQESEDKPKAEAADSTRGTGRKPKAAEATRAREAKEKQPEDTALAVRSHGAPPANIPHSPANFFQVDFRHLDRNLTDEARQEWNGIYASFRSQSILTGTVVGVDQNELPVRNEDGKIETRVISSLVVIGYRVKILIPENAVWMKGEERSTFLMRGMIGASVDYVVINVDREGEVALASRSLAMVKRRRAFSSGRSVARPGDIVDCSALVVGAKRCLLTCGGYDIPMRPTDMSYTSMLDMREVYRPGQELKARVLSHNPAQRELRISVKESTSNPFDGAERRHPVGSRRQAVITAKYKGGVFCTMQDGTVCLCLYSNAHYDSEFLLGDNVIIYISQYNYRERHIYGRIVSKW